MFVSEAASDGQDVLAEAVDTTRTPTSRGVCIELCAGLVDKKLSLVEIARQEVLEECGFDAPVESFEVIVTSRGNVGIAGNKMTMFYVEVTESMRKGPGGGNPDEGESIELVEVAVKDSMNYILSPESSANKSIGLCFAVMWYHQNKLK